MLIVENLSLTRTRKTIFSNINFHCAKGDIIQLLGQNGAGKSSFIYTMSGIIPTHISGQVKGNITIENHSLLTFIQHNKMQKIGLVMQNPELQMLSSNTKIQLLYNAAKTAIPKEKIEAKLKQYLHQLPFLDLEKKMSHYSFSQKKIILFLSQLLINPTVLLLDEIFSGLDSIATDFILKELHNFPYYCILTTPYQLPFADNFTTIKL